MRRRFFAERVENGRAELAGAQAAHLARVLRAQPGQQYELACQGRLYLAQILAATPRAVSFGILAELPAPAPGPAIELAVALFKFDRFEWMLEKATELGVLRLHPLRSRRTDPRLEAAAPKRLERWRAILLGAAEQSRRADCPEIAPLRPLDSFLASPPPGRRLLLSETPDSPPLLPAQESVILLAGPEGGFAPEEHGATLAAGFAPVSLGPRILRCETAVLAALARLGAMVSDVANSGAPPVARL